MAGWLVLMVAAFAEGVVRRLALEPLMPRIIAEAIGIVAVLFTRMLISCWLAKSDRMPTSMAGQFLVGFAWVLLTIGFEFGFFGGVMDVPTEQLIENDNLAKGHLFPLGLHRLLFVPLISRLWSIVNSDAIGLFAFGG